MTSPRQDPAIIGAAYLTVHRDLIARQVFRSCLNCLNFQPANPKRDAKESCLLYKAMPPAEVVVFSCGPGWEADIPF